MENKLSKEFLAILACPDCKKSLKHSKDQKELVCAQCKQKYEVKEGIPILIPVKTNKNAK
jgi:uncharacterized protein